MSNNIRQFPFPAGDKSDGPGNTGGGNPPGGDPMEARVSLLEKTSQEIREKLIRLETKMDHMASKEDLQSVKAQLEASMRGQLQWFVGLTWTASIALVGVTYFMATHLGK
jgi:hypothetical protein